MKEYYKNERVDVINIIPNVSYASILEIGGGEFPTLKRLKEKFNSEAWGVDIRQTSNTNINFIYGSIEDDNTLNQIPDNYFDLIVANDVIEHLVDTDKFFAAIFAKMKKGGFLALSVPNVRQMRSMFHILIKGNFPRHDAGLFDKTHLRWFCKRDILNIAENHGFETVMTKSVGRIVPNIIQNMVIAEFLALHNLFLFKK